MSKGERVLEVKDLTTRFNTQDGVVHAVNGISFDLHEGELLGVVGESGSGKSVTMMSLLKLIPMPPGEIVKGSAHFEGDDLVQLEGADLRKVRGGRIGFIFQDPMTSLNPVLTIGKQIVESLELHTDLKGRPARNKAGELLEMVGLPDAHERLKSFPHELSGGMRQRVMIAIALACSPKVIIADEPTTALDVTIQAQIIEQIKKLREDLGTSVIWITHDLGVVAGLADRVLVMYGGKIVEKAPVRELFANPTHPYTQGLLRSIPRLDQKGHELTSIEGSPPNLFREPTGCSFAPRCDFVHERCLVEVPELKSVTPDGHTEVGHESACFLGLDNERLSDHV